ncbi:universal stress protein [Algoriphagus namhaensis]|uniref:Universal stress protein n=1 Tax=Algoriphagus namhaensis TaxID=915353 RepID=A0ABV8AW20_9BACT
MESNFRILCPIDFSECSLNALEFATRLGELYKARLILYHVLNKSDYLKLSPDDPEGVHQKIFVTEKLQNLLEAVNEEALKNGLASAEIQMDEGQIVDTIEAFTKREKVDLIVMGTEGVNGKLSKTMGSRTSRLVGDSKVDVLVIPRTAYFKKFKLLAYAQDYLEEDKLAIQKVVEIASFSQSRVEVVHFEKAINLRTESLHLTMQEELRAFCKSDLVEFRLQAAGSDLKSGIEDYLEENKIDMLFTLSDEQGILDRLLDRSLSKKLANSIHTPLWVIKSF